jgi:hypothetical protein
MGRERNPNIQILEQAVEKLGPLSDKLVFLGGCATGLLLTDDAAPPIRATQDIDVITEVASLVDYHHLATLLRKRGFREDQSECAIICRWLADGLMLDVMPTSAEILGFGNEWYAPAFESARQVKLPSGKKIRLVTAPYFLATKLEAFDGRGNHDYVMSHDIEDIVAIVDGRPEIADEVHEADRTLRGFLSERFARLLADPRFGDALPGHMPSDPASQDRIPIVIERITAIAEIK